MDGALSIIVGASRRGFFPVVRRAAKLALFVPCSGVFVEVAMNVLARISFSRRPVADGSCASFCNKCFDTVAVSRREAELDAAEHAHVCDPWRLKYWKSLAETRRTAKPG